MDKQSLFNKIKSQTGQDFSRNRGVRSYLARLNGSKLKPWHGESVEALRRAFLPHTDEGTALAAAIKCANKYLNGGQMPGFGGQVKLPDDQMSSVYCDPEQAKKTLQAIKPETIVRYKQVIEIIQTQIRKEQSPYENPNQALDS